MPSRSCSRPTSVLLALALAGSGVVALSAPASAAPEGGALLYGLTSDGDLVTFRTGSGALLSNAPITGLDDGDAVVGIDVRSATGQLFAVANGATAGSDTLYTVNPTTAVATKVADLSTDLEGTAFGVDFNPTVDRLRIVSNTAQNLRVVPTTGVVTVDGDLTNPDGALGPLTPGPAATVTAAAYDNNVASATTTTLYDIDTTRNVIQVQNPPNDGDLTTERQLTATAPTAGSDAGFDIDGLTGTGYAVLDVAGQRGLYTVALTGAGPAATRVGTFVLPDVVDLAVATPRLGFTAATASTDESDPFATFTVTRVGDLSEAATVQFTTTAGTATAGSDFTATSGTLAFASGASTATITVPVTDDEQVEPDETFTITLSEPSTAAVLLAQSTLTVTITNDDAGPLLYGLTSADGLVQIRAESGIVSGPVAISGLLNGDDVVGIDVRPSTGQLVAVAKSPTTGVGSLYVLNPTTGAATRVAGLTNATGGTPLVLTGTAFAVDVNPAADALRIIGNDDQNLRANLTTGVTTVDGTLNPGAPVITAAAYTNSVAGAESTVLYDLDVNGDDLYEQVPPNSGTLVPRAPLGVDATGDAGYDIDGATGTGYASLTVGGTTGLYEITESQTTTPTAAAQRLGTFALPGVVDITVATPRLSVVSQTVAEGATATITVTRSGDTSRSATVAYATSSGTATSGTDFTPASGTLTFGAGERSKTFTVATTADTATEDAETVALTLSDPSDGSLVTAPGTLTITDVPRGGFTVATAQTVAESTSSVVVTVTRSAPTAGAATVQYATANGTATAGTDYTATSGTLSFASGETSKTVTVPILNDTVFEPDETFTFTLSNPTGTGALGGGAVQTVTITDDDTSAGAFSVQPTLTVSEAAGSALVTVTRGAPATGAATVAYATANGTATAGTDYTATSGTVSFAAGETSKTVAVPVLEDTAEEPAETFTFTLSAPSAGSSLGAGTVQTVTITDNDGAAAATPTSISIDATPLVRFPAAPVITGVLRNAAGAPLAGREVFVIYKQQAVPGLAAFRPVLRLTTDAQGVYRGSIRPTVNAVWQAIYLGSETEQTSGSPYDVTKIQVAIPTVNGFGRTLTVRAGTRVNVSGNIQPGALRHPVVLQWIRPDGIFNLTPASRATAQGSFVLGRSFAPGTYRLRVLGVNTANNIASASRTITLRVV